jgi:hypothetical protein
MNTTSSLDLASKLADAGPGDTLINSLDCFPPLDELRTEFDIIEFLDFCAGIEAAVLHGHLFSVGSNGDPARNCVLKALLQEEILTIHEIPAYTPEDQKNFLARVQNHHRTKFLQSFRPAYFDKNDLDFQKYLFVSSVSIQLDVFLEAELQIPLVLPAHGLPIYLQLPDVQAEQKAACWFHNALAKTYSDIKNLLFAIREEVDGFDYIQIPPIAIEAFSRCQTLAALEYVVLELRE